MCSRQQHGTLGPCKYLSDIKQNKQQTTAELDIYIKDLVRRCQFTRAGVEARKIDLLYHATVHFEVRKFVHNAKPEELTYDRMIEVAKAHERTCHEYQQHKQAHSAPVSSYQNPLIQTNAVRKSFQKTRSCGKCGQSHPQGQCPAHCQSCHSCGKKGHWTQMCRTRRSSSTGRTPSPHPPNRQRRPSGGKPFKQQGGGGGKGSGKFFKKGTPNKHKKGGAPPKRTHSLKLVISEEENVSKSVGISGPTHPPKEKYSLQNETGKLCSNPFTCYALGNGNGSEVDDSNKKYKVYTDTDSDGKTEIITDINCKFKGKVFAMEVKVDPGSETNCIPLSHFRHLFPQLCKTDGLPKETALEPTLAQFEAYDGGIMQAHGWTIMPTQNISTKKFHPVRYYVVEREDARILISHATASWLDLMRVLCTNKAPKCKRQVASVTKKLKEPLQAHDIPSQPWERIAMDHVYQNGRLYLLVCDYFSKFPFIFQTKSTSFAYIKEQLEELFGLEGAPDEIMSDNGPPFSSREFNSFLSGLGIKHTTSSPNHPQSNGFIERQIQTVKRLMEKATSTGRSFQEALTGLRATPIAEGMPSPAEILHGRNLTTRKAISVDLKAVRQHLIQLQAKYIKQHDKAR